MFGKKLLVRPGSVVALLDAADQWLPQVAAHVGMSRDHLLGFHGHHLVE